MPNIRRSAVGAIILFGALAARPQMPPFPQMQGEKVSADVALDRALKASSLTFEGKPFHVVMEIGTAPGPYSGRIEVWWVNAAKYRLAIHSPNFSQQKIVDGDLVREEDKGDYYPRWLENFVLALLDPLPMARNFRGGNSAVMLGPQITRSCLRRDDRPGGITDQMTWGDICLSGAEPHLSSVLTMNDSMEFSDWKGFGKKQIARAYQTNVLDYQPVVGRLTTLEDLKNPDEAMFVVTEATPADQRIATAFVSTLKEESLMEAAPEIQWPAVREGKTEGYMIVYARTDRTGQVRETAKHNSDNAQLEQYGMEQALRYKFKPLIVDGVTQQMEMPLVLHFISRIDNPVPILSAAEMRRRTISCDLGGLKKGILPKGTIFVLRVSVDETGKVMEMAPITSTPGLGAAFTSVAPRLEACRFAPYAVEGKPTYYKGDIEFTAP